MAITPNCEALKHLTSFAIDAQFCQQYDAQAFHYSGKMTPVCQHLCATFSEVIDDIANHMAAIKNHIPVTGYEDGLKGG